ncbi:Hypothetical Protein FCC1311_070351 [Hondaea fermentalgiana]|uniref:Lipase-like C-terminal domain-containing protein n=1 Tax=Hondaea fermentalgiana TaxID=2315210 RepID=A0A2R5GNY9_9STRA|nr:Hypothetical Protein FCC1311_070351 [Hondaea fermentalgiana]|eukprot:GBG32335.1 Hypothetical Protein FCC1311_070351 [Hondaea fermentalgiana]
MAMTIAAIASLPGHSAAKEVAVFIHGLGGFAPDEFFGFPYWVYINEFTERGFEAYQAEVGPVSSNHDRACEAYAQIMGTVVDYGKVHSERHGHNRYGRNFTGKGFYPEWSTENPIHILGHSMGGSTIRKLEILLQEGIQEEIDATPPEELSPLFAGLGTMIKTMTSFSGTHDGSTLEPLLGEDIVRVIEVFILGFAGISEDTFIDEIYGFDLSQWNITKLSNETIGDFFTRMRESPIWSVDNLDLAPFDLSPDGALVQQEAGQHAYPDTHYFAFSTSLTQPVYRCNDEETVCGYAQEASPLMWAGLSPFANIIGDVEQPQDLRENDGLVPVESSKCPQLAYPGTTCIPFDPNSDNDDWEWVPGQWYYQYTLLDHLQIIGWTYNDADDDRARANFANQAQRILRAVGADGGTDLDSTMAPTPFKDAAADEGRSASEVAAIAGGSVGSALALAALALVLWIRRSSSATFAADPATSLPTSASASPSAGLQSARVGRREPASIVVSSANPSYVAREPSF